MHNLEKNIIVLNACSSLINDMVNRSLFTVCGEKDSLIAYDEEIQILPHTEIHQKFFNILLVEFLSGLSKEALGLEKIPQNQKDIGYLYYLKNISYDSIFDAKDYTGLQKTVRDFLNWLDKKCTVKKVWLPSINTKLNLSIPRWQFIKICGDISKHGFIRLDKRVSDIVSVLKNNSIEVSKNQAYLVLPEFYEWFHNDIFNYHINTIVEFLNNINWAIYRYIRPIREDNYFVDTIANQVAKSMCYDLKSFKPYMPKFKTSVYLKKRY
jgi:hypothetical protein